VRFKRITNSAKQTAAANSGITIVRLAFFIVCSLLLGGCSQSDLECDIINVRDHFSPDGQRVATVYGYVCYNTTGYDKYVDLHRAGTKMRHPGNVVHVGPGDAVSVTWASATELAVRYYYETVSPAPASTNIDGVTITFKAAPELRGTQ
jgi:hypothetical protein